MKSLELKIPPLLFALLIAFLMWVISLVTPSLDMPTPYRLGVAITIAVMGITFVVAGAISFRLARTTINPTKPELASSLVNVGIYRFTRNPMYVGFLIALIAWAVFLTAPWTLVGPLAFFFYIDRFQIIPEEKALLGIFGAEYAAYRTKVRRWL